MDWSALIIIAVLVIGLVCLSRLAGSAPPGSGSYTQWLAEQQTSRQQRRGTH